MIAKELLGKKIGPYLIESIVGSGGMAVVYQARNPQHEAVALKVLFPPPGTGKEVLARFEREATTAARLNHPAIVRVIDAGQDDERAYMAMTLVEGQTLTARLAQVGKFDEILAADIAWQVADALYYAHRQGVVHRDVKSSNILVTDDGRALLTDFGVAQALDDPSLTRTGHTVGTPAYMAPEQASGRQAVDGRADLYSLGVVLYQMVTGRVPFEGSTPQVLHAHVYDPPPAPSTVAVVSPAMEEVILKALAKDVSERFQTGAAMAQALAQLDKHTRVQLEVTPTSTEINKRGIPPGVWAILLVGLLGIAAVTWLFGRASVEIPVETKPVAVSSPVASATSRPWPTSTPSPSITATPTPTVPRPPSLTPVLDSISRNTATAAIVYAPATDTPHHTPEARETPTATSAPSPTATTCPLPIDNALIPLLNIPLDESLDCPRTPAETTPAAWQPFENGLLLWRGDLNLIYGVGPGEAWFITGDTWREGDDPYDPAIIAPEGYYQPVRGFGKAWRERPGVRTALGWGLTEEIGFTAVIQEFTDGQVWHDAARNRFMVLFNSGNYQLVEGVGSNGQQTSDGQ